MVNYDKVFEAIKLNLEAQQLILINQRWANGDQEEKSRILNEQISNFLNPKQGNTLSERTHDALSGDSE